jgi:heterodisulfide reductase subunit A-like polyferredoxin
MLRTMATILALVSMATNILTTTISSTNHVWQPVTSSHGVANTGGGVSGIHAASRFQQLGHSVLVVGESGCLGGHVNSSSDPAAQKTFDFGVTTFDNNVATQNAFSYLGIAVAPYAPGNTTYFGINGAAQILNIPPTSIPWTDSTSGRVSVPGYL